MRRFLHHYTIYPSRTGLRQKKPVTVTVRKARTLCAGRKTGTKLNAR
jgi:hypothetical protein